MYLDFFNAANEVNVLRIKRCKTSNCIKSFLDVRRENSLQ